MLLHLINYNTYIMLRKAELWRLNELTTGDRGLIEKKTGKQHVQECESTAIPHECFRPFLGAFTTM